MWNPLDGVAKVNVAITKQHPDAQIPQYMSRGAAGADLYSVQERRIRPGSFELINTGIAVQLPPGFEIQIRPRSGLALRHGITVLNAPGTIDSDYRGQILVMLINHGEYEVHIKPGDRIAQMVIMPVFHANFEVVDMLEISDRGAGGFGSTGA